jgi:hypothetical protein
MRLSRHLKSTLHFAVVVSVSGSSSVLANQRAGTVNNSNGQKCQYEQSFEADSKYFHGTVTAKRGTITFADRQCMKADVNSSAINKMMINNVVSRWYSHSDAAFMTREEELYPGSLLQKRGLCIQSRKYPLIGITIEYVVSGGSIAEVHHGAAVKGCKK